MNVARPAWNRYVLSIAVLILIQSLSITSNYATGTSSEPTNGECYSVEINPMQEWVEKYQACTINASYECWEAQPHVNFQGETCYPEAGRLEIAELIVYHLEGEIYQKWLVAVEDGGITIVVVEQF